MDVSQVTMPFTDSHKPQQKCWIKVQYMPKRKCPWMNL